jgi:hypothetical protein
MIVFEKHSDGHDNKIKVAHGGYVGRSAR